MSDITSTLAASRENVARARRKFEQLKSSIDRYSNSGAYSIRTQYNDGMIHLIASRDKEPDIDIAFDTVEIVQRIRVSLDKAVSYLVEHNGRGSSGVGFPFGGIDGNTGKPLPFPDERMMGKHGLSKKLTPEQWDFICAQRPYPGGNDTLWAINEIANVDKHRKDLVALIPKLDYGMNTVGFVDYLVMRPAHVDHLLSDKERETVLCTMGPRAAQTYIEHSFHIDLVFGEGVSVKGRSVLSTLNEQIRQVTQVLSGMRQLF
ncbi:hypothetical protein [Sphingopyxis sp. MC1]|mgnify:CR=1 FL=1|uniref:hypothetical protein n=1 Tax=Sphingopyxis sp. MC1 TaxID=1174684 RepID=UPI0012DEE7C9|nr:hypothetical protein [Sphingopyxis sp. MC1]